MVKVKGPNLSISQIVIALHSILNFALISNIILYIVAAHHRPVLYAMLLELVLCNCILPTCGSSALVSPPLMSSRQVYLGALW